MSGSRACARKPLNNELGLQNMEQYSVTRVERGLHVDGFPDAVKLIQLEDPKARRISDLLLHRHDLEFADQCLEEINRAPSDLPTVREALWRCAIVHFAKCFGNSRARFQLSRDKIYKWEPPEAKLAFDYFQNLRDKHVVHDENSYSQSLPGAVLNRGNKPYKIEKILCFGAHASTLEQGNYGNLKFLIQKALKWVVTEFDLCCDLVTKELEALSYEELLMRENVMYRVPTVEEISTNRLTSPKQDARPDR